MHLFVLFEWVLEADGVDLPKKYFNHFWLALSVKQLD